MEQEIKLEKSLNKRNIYIDLFKVLMAFFVIILHYSFVPLTRIAVPFFFMIAGFFAYSSSADHEKSLMRTKKRIFDCLKYLLVGFIIYFIGDICVIIFNGNSLQNYFLNIASRNLITSLFILNEPLTSSGFHLWFLWAFLVVNIIQYFLIKYNKTDIYKFICIPLLLIHLLLTVYLKNTPLGLTNLNLTRNAIFFGLPLFGIGYLLGQKKLELSKRKLLIYLILAILFFGLQILEDYFYTSVFSMANAEFFICSVVSSALFIIILTNLKTNSTKLNVLYKIFGQKYYFYLYIVHIAVANTTRSITGINGILLVLLTIIIASAIFLAFRWIIISIKKHKISKDINK